MRGPAPIETAVKRPGEALPFHDVKGDGRSGGKQNPGRLQGWRCQRDGWVGRLLASPLHLSFLPACPVGTRRQAGLPVQHPCGTETKQKPREDAALPLPTVRLSPWQPRLQLAPSTCWALQTNLATTQSCHSRGTSAPTTPQGSLATGRDMPLCPKDSFTALD